MEKDIDALPPDELDAMVREFSSRVVVLNSAREEMLWSEIVPVLARIEREKIYRKLSFKSMQAYLKVRFNTDDINKLRSLRNWIMVSNRLPFLETEARARIGLGPLILISRIVARSPHLLVDGQPDTQLAALIDQCLRIEDFNEKKEIILTFCQRMREAGHRMPKNSIDLRFALPEHRLIQVEEVRRIVAKHYNAHPRTISTSTVIEALLEEYLASNVLDSSVRTTVVALVLAARLEKNQFDKTDKDFVRAMARIKAEIQRLGF